MFGQIGGLNAIGAPLLDNQIGGESFIRHIGNDKLLFDFHEGSGTTVHDKSHNNNNGTLGAGDAAPTWKRNSLYFDGGDYVDLTGINHGISTGEFSFCFDITNIPNGKFLFEQETIRFLFAATDTKIYFYHVSVKCLTDSGITSIISLVLQITRDVSGNLECYVNGKSGDKDQSDTTDLTYNGTSIICLGTDKTNTYGATTIMYSFRILNKGLSGIECQQEYLVNKFRGNN